MHRGTDPAITGESSEEIRRVSVLLSTKSRTERVWPVTAKEQEGLAREAKLRWYRAKIPKCGENRVLAE